MSLRLHDVPLVGGENRDGPATGNWLVQRMYHRNPRWNGKLKIYRSIKKKPMVRLFFYISIIKNGQIEQFFIDL